MRLLKVPHTTKCSAAARNWNGHYPTSNRSSAPSSPREVAGPAAFLLSNLASAMTGTAVGVDGGPREGMTAASGRVGAVTRFS